MLGYPSKARLNETLKTLACSVFDISSLLATVLLGVSFILATRSIRLLVFCPAINLGLAGFLTCILLYIAPLSTLLGLLCRNTGG